MLALNMATRPGKISWAMGEGRRENTALEEEERRTSKQYCSENKVRESSPECS
jgi:hypothetical protein